MLSAHNKSVLYVSKMLKMMSDNVFEGVIVDICYLLQSFVENALKDGSSIAVIIICAVTSSVGSWSCCFNIVVSSVQSRFYLCTVKKKLENSIEV